MGEKVFASQAGRAKECHLRMRARIKRGRLGPIQGRVLSVRDYLPGFRCRNDFSAAFCRLVYRFECRRVCGDGNFPFVIGGRSGLGVAERSAYVEVDQGLKSELSK